MFNKWSSALEKLQGLSIRYSSPAPPATQPPQRQYKADKRSYLPSEMGYYVPKTHPYSLGGGRDSNSGDGVRTASISARVIPK
jgi:hypothetical protein